MRLWSIHPAYLDAKGLVALWREALLAQKVLQGKTKGYKNHPQLLRFRNCHNPKGAIGVYLTHVADEADNRNYSFDRKKILNKQFEEKLPVTRGQVRYEFSHLLRKLIKRDAGLYTRLKEVKRIKLHPIFYRITGNIEDWEIT